MPEHQTDVLLDGLAFPEGPRWHDGTLYCSDMHAGVVLTVDTSGRSDTVVDVSARPSGLGWLPDGTLLVVSMLDRCVLSVSDGTADIHADLSTLAPAQCNDMVVDANGRAYVGNFGFDLYAGEQPRPTPLVRVDAAGSASVAAEDMMFPNGSVITPDGTTLIVAETMGARLTAFDIDASGDLSNKREWASVEGHMPDGICMDADGGVWVASPIAGMVLRVLEGGNVTDTVRPSAGHAPYACMLGGVGGNTLFVCTSAAMLPEDTLAQRSGRIETVDVAVPHAGLP